MLGGSLSLILFKDAQTGKENFDTDYGQQNRGRHTRGEKNKWIKRWIRRMNPGSAQCGVNGV